MPFKSFVNGIWYFKCDICSYLVTLYIIYILITQFNCIEKLVTCESTLEMRHLIFLFKNVTTWRQMLPVFCLIFKSFEISLNPFLVANSNQNEKKIGPLSLVCHGLPENAFQVNQLYNVTWSITHLSLMFLAGSLNTWVIILKTRNKLRAHVYLGI